MGPFEMIATCVAEVCFAAMVVGVAWAAAYCFRDRP